MVESCPGDFRRDASKNSVSGIYILAGSDEGKLRLLQPLETTLIRIAVDLRLFDALSADQKSSKSSDDLASLTKADPAFLGTGCAFPF